jgi:hypothetical protein
VEGYRRDVQVIVMSYLNTPWYARQVRDLTTPCPQGVSWRDDPTRIICQRDYLPDQGPDFYRELVTAREPIGVGPDSRMGPVPTRSILPLTDQQIDEVAFMQVFVSREAQVFRAHNLEAVIPAGQLMLPATIFLAQIIDAAMDDRPIYFAMTTQAYEELSLRPFLIRQGVALKLHDGPVQEDAGRGIMEVPPSQLAPIIGPFIDVPRTEALLSDVFMHRGGIPERWGHWADAATDGIPAYYGYTHMGLGHVYDTLGDTARANHHYGVAEGWLRLANLRFIAARGQ